MPIYDHNGSASTQIGKVYDWNGSVNTQIGKVYDSNGTTNSLIYTATEIPLVLYDGPNRINKVTPQGHNNIYVYEERYDSTYGYYYYLVPWTDNNASHRFSAEIRSTSTYDLTDYKSINVTYMSQDWYGDAAHDTPRLTIYTSTASWCNPYNDNDGVKTSWFKQDGSFGSWKTVSLDITSVTGPQYVYVGNWATGGTSQVRIQKFWLT